MTRTTTPRTDVTHGKHRDLFSEELSVPFVELEFELRSFEPVPWSPFVLNPRRLRGSDFLMRWSQGQWSEDRFVHAVNQTGRFFSLPYGPSGTAPDNDPREFELYFERLEAAGLSDMKRPDLLIYNQSDQADVEAIVRDIGGVQELPFTLEDDERMQELLARAIIAVECENSLWKARQMPDYGSELRPMRRLAGQLGLPKNAVLPTVIIKEEDRGRLQDWQDLRGVPIHVWHGFYDVAFGIALDTANALIGSGRIEPTQYRYQAANGSVSVKTTYFIYYHYAYPLAVSRTEPHLVADHLVDANGHILPYVRFEGGEMELTSDALEVLDDVSAGVN